MKKNYFYLLILTLLFLLFPLPTFAAFWDSVVNALLYLPTLAIAVVFWFVIILSGGITWLMGAFLNWVISPGFVSLSYTRIDGPNANPIIGMGLNITQSFVNLALVVILVVIALSIALRLGEYGSKKIFAKLIIVALLVNFAPVLVGLIVDASNIVMHYFLDAITEGAMEIGSQVSDYSAGLAKVFKASSDTINRVGLLMQGITQIVVNLAMAFAFLLFALLFLVRYVVIWTLVILSPLAFVALILPGTKKAWDMWWNQLIQWSIIGIPIAFFLYLALNSFSYLRSAFVSSLEMPGLEPATVGFLNQIFPFFVIIVFLILGFTIGLQTGAMGASSVISFGKSVPGRIAKTRVGAKTLGGLASGAAKGLGKVGSFMGRMEEKAGKIPIVGKGLKPIAGVALGGYMTRGIGRLAGPALLKYAAETRRVPKADLDDINRMSGADAEAYTKQKAIFGTDRLQYMARMAENEQLEYTSPDFQTEAKALRASTFIKENPHFQKEAHTLRKALGDMGTEELVYSKLVGLTGPKREEKEKEIRGEIEKTGEIIQERLGDEGITIEAGLKLKYITKEEVDKDKVKAVADARARLTDEEKTKFLTNTIAAATDVKELKPEDIKKMIDPDTLATRIGLTLGNPRNLQKIQDSFGHKKLKSVIKGRGGLDDATNTPEKLVKFAKDINPAMTQAIFTSPAYREIDIEARKHMLDAAGRPTERYPDFKERQDIFSRLEKLGLDTFVAAKDRYQRRIEEAESTLQNLRLELSHAQAAKAPTTGIQQQIVTEEGKITRAQTRLRQVQTQIQDNVRRLARDPQKAKELERIRNIEEKKGTQIIS